MFVSSRVVNLEISHNPIAFKNTQLSLLLAACSLASPFLGLRLGHKHALGAGLQQAMQCKLGFIAEAVEESLSHLS